MHTAAMKQHGSYLPVGAKINILNERLHGEYQRCYPVPCIYFQLCPLGTSDLHLGTPGTVSLSWQTMCAEVRDLMEPFLSQDIKKVIVLVGLTGCECGSGSTIGELYHKECRAAA